MGCFDSVRVPCPKCGEKVDFQTKSGPCFMLEFDLDDAPDDVLLDVNRHAPGECPKCGTKFCVGIRDGRYVPIPEGEECILSAREILAARTAQSVRSGILSIARHYGMEAEMKDLARRLSKEAYDWASAFDEKMIGERIEDVERKAREAEEKRRKILDELTAEAEKNRTYDPPPDDKKGGESA